MAARKRGRMAVKECAPWSKVTGCAMPESSAQLARLVAMRPPTFRDFSNKVTWTPATRRPAAHAAPLMPAPMTATWISAGSIVIEPWSLKRFAGAMRAAGARTSARRRPVAHLRGKRRGSPRHPCWKARFRTPTRRATTRRPRRRYLSRFCDVQRFPRGRPGARHRSRRCVRRLPACGRHVTRYERLTWKTRRMIDTCPANETLKYRKSL